jgi:hypothetical protein
MGKGKQTVFSFLTALAIMLFLMVPVAFAAEADIKLPDLSQVSFMGGALSGMLILNLGLVICNIPRRKACRPIRPCWTFPRRYGKLARLMFFSRESSWQACGY